MMWAASASFWAAWYSPSAWMILPRRSRSASAWAAMARFIPGGNSTSFTSTAVTFIPQGAVCSSMISRMDRLSFSRWARSSSRSDFPRTLRRVVWAIWKVAARKSATSIMEASGWMTRKKMMASTLRVTLSLVITSWAGTLMTTTRVSILRMTSTKGMMMRMPGGRVPTSLPRRKTTPASYCQTTLTVAGRRMMKKRTITPTTSRLPMLTSYLFFTYDRELQALQALDKDLLPLLDGPLQADGLPQLAVGQDSALGVERGLGHRRHAHHALPPRLLRSAVGADHGGDGEEEEGPQPQGHPPHQPAVDGKGGAAEEEKGAHQHGSYPPCGQKAVGGNKGLRHQHGEGQEHEQYPCPGGPQYPKGVEGEEEGNPSHHPREDGPRVGEFHRYPQKGQGQENVGHIGLADGVEETLHKGHGHVVNLHSLGLRGGLSEAAQAQ